MCLSLDGLSHRGEEDRAPPGPDERPRQHVRLTCASRGNSDGDVDGDHSGFGSQGPEGSIVGKWCALGSSPPPRATAIHPDLAASTPRTSICAGWHNEAERPRPRHRARVAPSLAGYFPPTTPVQTGVSPAIQSGRGVAAANNGQPVEHRSWNGSRGLPYRHMRGAVRPPRPACSGARKGRSSPVCNGWRSGQDPDLHRAGRRAISHRSGLTRPPVRWTTLS